MPPADLEKLIDLGTCFEGRVVEAYADRIIRQAEPIYKNGQELTKIDFKTAEAIFEVGLSLRGKERQLRHLAEVALARGKKLVVVHGPEVSYNRIKDYLKKLRAEFGDRLDVEFVRWQSN